jgi:hypothetical protein
MQEVFKTATKMYTKQKIMSQTQLIFPPQLHVSAFMNKSNDGLLVEAATCNYA